MLNLNADEVCVIIVKSCELDVQPEEPTGDSSNDTDDAFASVYTKAADSSVRKAIVQFMGRDG
ncbi:MAG: hypothetical protein ACLPSF_08825 [Methylocella sp.]